MARILEFFLPSHESYKESYKYKTADGYGLGYRLKSANFVRGDESSIEPKFVEPGKGFRLVSTLDPWNTHWFIPVAAACVSLASSAVMAPKFGTSLVTRRNGVLGATFGSAALATALWYQKKDRPNHLLIYNDCPEIDVRKGTIRAAFVCVVPSALWGGYSVGHGVRKVNQIVSIFAQPIFQRFIFAPPGILCALLCGALGYVLSTHTYEVTYTRRKEFWDEVRRNSVPKEVYQSSSS